MSLSSEKIQSNWKQLIDCIKNTFEDDYLDNRRERLLEMYHHLEDRMAFAPASGRNYYHNCFPGGYVDHVLRVIKFAQLQYDLWKDNGANVDNYTKEELIFVAMHHDLGKVGDLNHDYYIPNDSDLHRKNQGMIFTHNPKLQYMTVTDRAIFLLNHFGISMTEWEYIGLRLTDGLYEEANKNYYIGYQPSRSLKSNIAYILHQADSMATHIEYDKWKQSTEEEKVEVKKRVENIKKELDPELKTKHKDLFDELFGDKVK